MIKTKEDLKYYIMCDSVLRGGRHPSWHGDDIWKYQILYRKTEYYYNNRHKDVFHRILYLMYIVRFRRSSKKLGMELGFNVFDEGLIIYHGQGTIVNGNAKVGRNCSISARVCIGQAKGGTPTIGDNTEISIGSTIVGPITITHDVTIAPGAVVVKDIDEPYTTWGGVPAACISHKKRQYLEERKSLLESVARSPL